MLNADKYDFPPFKILSGSKKVKLVTNDKLVLATVLGSCRMCFWSNSVYAFLFCSHKMFERSEIQKVDKQANF